MDIGLACPCGHFNRAFYLHAPATDRDIDRQGKKRTRPTECSDCGASLADLRLTAEGQEREGPPVPTRNGLAQTGLGRSGGSKRPQEGPLTPAEWKRRVFDRQRPRPDGPALCAVTGEPLDFVHDDAHHPLEKRLLRDRGLYDRVWDERNGMAVKRRVHEGQTNGMRRIPREAVPQSAWEFAREVGPWAVARVEADHPPKKKEK